MPSLGHILSIVASLHSVCPLFGFMYSSYLNLVTTKGKVVNINLSLWYYILLTFTDFGEGAQMLLAYRCSVWLSYTISHP